MADTKPRQIPASDIEQVLTPCGKEIPSVSPAMTKLLEICDDVDASAADLSRIVETDPGIAAKVMGIANSALYSPRHRITGVSDAVILLGFDEIKKISLGVTVFEEMIKPEKKKHFDRFFFWRHCLCVAILSRTIAEECGYPNPEQAYVCGLLHDLGKIVFDLYGRVDYDGFIASVARHTGSLIAEEKAIMGMGHDEIGAYFCTLWHLPDTLSLAVGYHHQQFEHLNLSQQDACLVAIVSLADFLSWVQGMGSIDVIRPPVLQPEVEKIIDQDRIDFSRLITCMDKEMQAVSQFYNFVFPSPGKFRENMFRANLRLGNINTQYYFMHDQRMPDKEMSRLRHSLTTPHRSLDPKAIITTTLEAVYKDFRFNRLYIMRMVKTLRRLRVYEWFDETNTGIDLRAIEIPINRTAGGFVTCMRNKEPVLITGRTTGEKQALEAFDITEMVIVPFCSQNKVIGILGMDNIVSQKPILPDTLSAIAIVANELGTAMENAGMYKEAKAASLKDGLTGLLNRVAIDELLAKAFRKAVEEKTALSLVMIDIDYFKRFNDDFGHQAGDNIIKLIATTLKRLSRPFDHVGRYGGEEFIVVLNDTELSKALVYGERIRREIAHLGRLLASRFPGTPLTISAGISEYKKNIRNKDDLIARADKALYRAKEKGRNRVEAG
ncbi:MAG: HDOD domain-containing protein [Desulfobacteraceae bacterium]